MKLKEIILKIIYPSRCVFCNSLLALDYEQQVCPKCKAKVKMLTGHLCEKCGKPIVNRGLCNKCRQTKHIFNKAYAVYLYEDAVRQSLHNLKYRDMPFLSRFYGRIMASYANIRQIPRVDYVVPVPIHPLRRLKRGYNQSLLLCKEYCSQRGETPCYNLIKRVGHTRPQSRLKRQQRQANVKNAFAINPKAGVSLKGKTVLIIDDIFTTGSTADECARVLKKAGAKEIYVYCVAISGVD